MFKLNNLNILLWDVGLRYKIMCINKSFESVWEKKKKCMIDFMLNVIYMYVF